MSTVKRFISGSAASWVQIGIMLVTQIGLVPIYLSHWSVAEYGCWLAAQAALGFSTLFSVGHQTYVGFELLKIGDPKDPQFQKVFFSSLPAAWAVAAIELTVVAVFVLAGGTQWLLGSDKQFPLQLQVDTGIIIVLQSFVWATFTSVGGILSRAVAPVGYYARNAWWYVLGTILTVGCSAIAVMLGADLLVAGIVQSAANIVYNVGLITDLWRIMRRAGSRLSGFDLISARRAVIFSTAISGRLGLDMVRQQGVRVILTPVIGVGLMTAFSTMRTASNVALQGLGTITNPLMPELMRYLRNSDQNRINATFAFIWLTAMVVLLPGMLFSQWIAPEVFAAWTRGKVVFDPPAFLIMNATLLIFSLSQPAMTVAKGFNLLRLQFVIALLSGVFALGLVVLFAYEYGVTGAALGIFSAELLSAVLYTIATIKWFREQSLIWPSKMMFMAILAIIVFVFGSIFMLIEPKYAGIIAIGTAFLSLLISCAVWFSISADLRKALINRLIRRK